MSLSPERQLACILDQHVWIADPDDIRFRECIYCGITQYLGKEVKRGRRHPTDREKRARED